MRASESLQTVMASSNETPCFIRFVSALRASHSNLRLIRCPQPYHTCCFFVLAANLMTGEMKLACLCEPFLFQHLRYVLSIHKHIGDGAAVDVLAMGHDSYRSFFEELFQPLPGF